jgi:hypothetical protein
MSIASCASTSAIGMAVSEPPLAHPQQSAGTRAQSASIVHSGGPALSAAQPHTWQPAPSTAKPPAHD